MMTLETAQERPIVIDVNDVRKKFRVYPDKGSTLKEKILFQNRRRFEERQVLKGISFQVQKGEAVGLIGHNGCGKSTTLKLLTRIMYPDQGTIRLTGRVSSLIELGAGFHPDMSGRENIYINASIFGLSRKEITERLDTIIAFSELEEFIDNPVRTYSSGMYMRLAFAVAINVNADILLIDEILAVGDVAFQAKCFNKLKEIKAQGTTIVIVSHSLGQIEQICDKTIWLDEGRIRMEGKPRDVHSYYLDFMNGNTLSKKQEQPHVEEENKPVGENKKRWGSREAQITHAELQDRTGTCKTCFKSGEPIRIVIEYKAESALPSSDVGIGIFRIDGLNIYGTNTFLDHMTDVVLEREGKAIFKISHLDLLPGDYLVDLALESQSGFPYDYVKSLLRFSVTSALSEVGVYHMEHEWELQ